MQFQLKSIWFLTLVIFFPAWPKICLAADEVRLPAPATSKHVGGSGQYVAYYMPSLHVIGVVDAWNQSMHGYIQVHCKDPLIAAGHAHVVVADPATNKTLVWLLKTLRPVKAGYIKPSYRSLKSIGIGANSMGPLITSGIKGTNAYLEVFDVETLDLIELRNELDWWSAGRDKRNAKVTVSADGKAVAIPARGVLRITGRDAALQKRSLSSGTILGPEGKYVYYRGSASHMGNTSLFKRPDNKKAQAFPVLTPGLTLEVTPNDTTKSLSLSIRQATDIAPLLTGSVTDYGDSSLLEFVGLTQRLLIVNKSNEVVTFTKLKVTEAARDKMVILTTFPPEVSGGESVSYAVRYIGDAKASYELVSGPAGMKVSPTGVVTWDVPRRKSAGLVRAVVSVRGQGTTVKHVISARIRPVGDERQVAKVNADFVPLNETIGQSYLGGGGKYLVVSLPEVNELVVLDVAKRQEIGRLPLPEKSLVAVGLDKLVIGRIKDHNIKVWTLPDVDNERTLTLPGPVRYLALGRKSLGPLWVTLSEGRPNGLALFDLKTGKKIPVEMPASSMMARVEVSPKGFLGFASQYPPSLLKYGFGKYSETRLEKYNNVSIWPVHFFDWGSYLAVGRSIFHLESALEIPESGYVVPGSDGDEYLVVSGDERRPVSSIKNLRNPKEVSFEMGSLPRDAIKSPGRFDLKRVERIWFAPSLNTVIHVTRDRKRLAFISVNVGKRATPEQIAAAEARPPKAKPMEDQAIAVEAPADKADNKINVEGIPGKKIEVTIKPPGGDENVVFQIVSSPFGAGVSAKGVVTYPIPKREPTGLRVRERIEIVVAVSVGDEDPRFVTVEIGVNYD